MKKKFTREEDIAIINAFMSAGFKLTKDVCNTLLEEECKERTEKSIKNRFYRTLAIQYKNFLTKDYHIRIALKSHYANSILNNAYSPEKAILCWIADKFNMDKKQVETLYYKRDVVWSKDNLTISIEGVPDTNFDLVNMYLEKEDSVLHLFDEMIDAIKKEEQKRIETKRKKESFWQKLKNLFKCKKCKNS